MLGDPREESYWGKEKRSWGVGAPAGAEEQPSGQLTKRTRPVLQFTLPSLPTQLKAAAQLSIIFLL